MDGEKRYPSQCELDDETYISLQYVDAFGCIGCLSYTDAHDQIANGTGKSHTEGLVHAPDHDEGDDAYPVGYFSGAVYHFGGAKGQQQGYQYIYEQGLVAFYEAGILMLGCVL